MENNYSELKSSWQTAQFVRLNILVTNLYTRQGVSSEKEGAARGQQDKAVWTGARAQRNVEHH